MAAQQRRVAAVGADQLPSGWVTFVFTDVVDSGLLLRRLGDEADHWFDLHDEVLRAVWARHDGHEINTEGDLFFVAFEDTGDALAACVDAQRALAHEEWPADCAITVRIGMHSGYARPRSGDYRCLAVHRAARVMSAAQARQILVSGTAVGSRQPPPGCRFHDLGRFRVRDFDEPERIFRLDPDDLEPNEAAIRATPAEHHNLRRAATSFHGRDAELGEIRDRLQPGAVVSLVGPGGIGKTRLATELGLAVADEWGAGVWVAGLADLTDSSLVGGVVVEAIGARLRGDDTPTDALAQHFGSDESILVLDNIEAHLDTTAKLVVALRAACPGLCILTTGREPLNVPAEWVHRVRPLDTRDAIELFIERASPHRSAAELAGDTTTSQICERLDGVPLAIEIAASKSGVLTPAEILDGLDDRFRLLQSRDRTLPDRHRTMTALLEWSHQLLEPELQRAWRCLSLFTGTFSLAAGCAALGADSESDVVLDIWLLVDKSLLEVDHSQSATRYRMPESIREFGRQLQGGSPEPDAVTRRLGAWYLEHWGPAHVPDVGWISGVRIEFDNIRGLIDQIEPIDVQVAQELACVVGQFRQATQSLATGVEELTPLVERLDTETPARVGLLSELADLHLHRAELDAARRYTDQADALQLRVGPPSWNPACVERSLGELATRSGDTARAIEIADRCLDRRLNARATCRMANLKGIAHYIRGEFAESRRALELELELGTQLGQDSWIAIAHNNLAEIALHLDDTAAASEHQAHTLDYALEMGQAVTLAYSFMIAARLAVSQKRWGEAALLHATGEAILEREGSVLYDNDLAEVERFWVDVDAHRADPAQQGGRRPTLDVDRAVSAARAVFARASSDTSRHARRDR